MDAPFLMNYYDGFCAPEFVYDALNSTLYYTSGQQLCGYDPVLGLPQFDLHYGVYDTSNMVEIMSPGLYVGPDPDVFPTPSLPAAPAFTVNPWDPILGNGFNATYGNYGFPAAEPRYVYLGSNPMPPQTLPIPMAAGPSIPTRAVPGSRMPIPSAGPARAASYASQLPRRAPSSLYPRAAPAANAAHIPSAGPSRATSYAHQGPRRARSSLHPSAPVRTGSQRWPQPISQRATSSQHLPQSVPSFQGRTPSRQIPSRGGSFLGPPGVGGNGRAPSFQGRSNSNVGSARAGSFLGPRVNANNGRAPSFQGRAFSNLGPARAGSFKGVPNNRAPSFQGRSNSGRVPTRSHEPAGYRPYTHALHSHFRELYRVERGQHFDHVDDAVIACYTQARGWDTDREPEVVLTIGAPVNPNDDMAWIDVWKIPIPFLGLRYNQLEVAFPLDQASVEKLPNDILRVLHVRLQEKHRFSVLSEERITDAAYAETQQQVLRELERRGFTTATIRGVRTQHIQGKPFSSDPKEGQSSSSASKTRPNASVLQPDAAAETKSSFFVPPAQHRQPHQQNLGYRADYLFSRLADSRSEIQDGPAAFTRPHHKPPVIDALVGEADTDTDTETDEIETPGHSTATAQRKVKFDPSILAGNIERASKDYKGKGKAPAIEIHEVEDEAEASCFAATVESPKIAEHETSDHEDLYNVSDKDETK